MGGKKGCEHKRREYWGMRGIQQLVACGLRFPSIARLPSSTTWTGARPMLKLPFVLPSASLRLNR